MDSPFQAPPVVAVVVTCDPGPWLEDALAALADQDYPNLSVLVIDAASADDPTARVAAVLPGAYVRRLPSNPGYAAATNEALTLVEGASHFLLCHDDVAPDPDAVRLMVEEAFRSNAGLVTPKLVDWDDPRRLLDVGLSVDKSGAPRPLVDRGELDQEQHDAVRDVFVAPGGCNLVRADLFASLGGFDTVMDLYGEDLDLSWRAQVAGARVVVAPAARVRHREAMSAGLRAPGGGPPPADPAELRRRVRPLVLRHRLRAVLKDYSTWHLVRVLPQVALLAVAEMVFGVLTGHTATARDTASAWTWNMRRFSEIRAARAEIRTSRQVPDGEVRNLQVRGSARFSLFVRGQLASERFRRRSRAALDRARALERPQDDSADARLSIAVWGAVAVVVLFGSRHLLFGDIPAVHQFTPLPGAWSLLRSFGSGWNQAGLGSESPAPAAFGLLGLGGAVLLGATGLLHTLLILGCLPVGIVGAGRLAAPFGSQRARLAAVVVYAAVPLPYNALATGNLHGLLAYALAPYVLRALLRAAGLSPFAAPGEEAGGVRRVLLPLGLLMAVGVALAPPLAVMLLTTAAGVAVGSLLVGEAGRGAKAVVAAAGALLVAAVLLLPWSLDFVLPGTRPAALTGVGAPAARALGLGALLRFHTGPLGAPPVGWVFVAAAAVPLVVGRSWRLAWAARMWSVAMVCWGLAWAGGRGWLRIDVPASDVLLAPAAAALALAVAVGLLTFQLDVPGYRFGWRQLAASSVLVAVLLGAIPVVTSALGGRWNMPGQDFAGLLSWMDEQHKDGAFRVLWLGDPGALPLNGWRLDDGLAYATSREGAPDATALWPTAGPGTAGRMGSAVRVARAGGTTSLGHLLASAAVRYVVVPLRLAPSATGATALPPPPDLVDALDDQVDLKKLQGDDALVVYENAAWAPGRARLAEPPPAPGRFTLAELRGVELSGATPVLDHEQSPTHYSGAVESGTVLLSESASPRWQLRVAGRAVPRSQAFGWVNTFEVTTGGRATLRYHTPAFRYAALAVQVLLWALVVRAIVAGRLRRRRAQA